MLKILNINSINEEIFRSGKGMRIIKNILIAISINKWYNSFWVIIWI